MFVPTLFGHSACLVRLACLLLVLVSGSVKGQDSAAPSARDIWQIGKQELQFLNMMPADPHSFWIDAYTQYLGDKNEVITDSWNLGRVFLGPSGLKVVELALPSVHLLLGPKAEVHGRMKKSSLVPQSPLRLEGIVPMIFPDSAGVGTDRYVFQYLGIETLGDLRTWTFMLKPRASAGAGSFSGKIWVADHDIVRFSGTFANPIPRQKGSYVSFDSVRFKTSTGQWVPWCIYLDQTGLPPSILGGRALRARISVWGFNSQAASLSGSVGVRLDENVDATLSGGTQFSSEDVYLEAEGNLIRWLEGIGLMAPAGKFEREVCDPIIQDIVTANHIALDRTLTCRILLTVPAETVLFESVIGVSKTVFDLAPNSAAIAVLIAREVALEQVRGRHLDLAWGRPDILFVRDEMDLIKFLDTAPTQAERDEADDLAMKYLARLNGYKQQDLESAAIFLYTASEACKTRPSLLSPRFGDGLPGCGRDAHISWMALAAPPGSDENPAMHVGSRTRLDPWTDTVKLIAAQQEHAGFRIIPEPMIPEVAPDDPDMNKDAIVQPIPLPHWTPPPAVAPPKKKRIW